MTHYDPTNDPYQGDWFGASVYDYIHPEDQEKARIIIEL